MPLYFLIIFLLSTYDQVLPAERTYQFPPNQLSALWDLYNATNGPSWQYKLPYQFLGYPWNFSVPNPNPCAQNWQGVSCLSTCEHTPCFLETMTLDSLGLTGSIVDSIGELTTITQLSLQRNYLTGTIPTNITNLTKLERLLLGFNIMSGSIPAELGNMTNLQSLYLGFNDFTGTIPVSLGNLYKLEFLFLFSNLLHGSIPVEICKLSNLLYLDLGLNYLVQTIPSCITNLTHLSGLYLYANILTGTIPNAIGSLNNLTGLYLYENLLHGTLPASLGNISNLRNLDLHLALFNGSIPSSLGNLLLLRNIDIGNCYFIGSIPSSFGNLSHLQSLYLGFNYFTSSLPSSLKKLVNLNYIYLYSNQLSGILPFDLFVNMTQLRSLYLGFNNFRGPLPESLGKLTQLQSLYLGYNAFTGTIPSSLGDLKGLVGLYLGQNNLTGSAPSSLSTLPELVYIRLNNNYLSGKLERLFNVSLQKKLSQVDISYNRFTGKISAEIFQNDRLQSFIAAVNCLSGSLSEAMCNATTLETLILDGLHADYHCNKQFYWFGGGGAYALSNAVYGTIPTCLFEMPFLETLHASGNGLKGTLPNAVPIGSNLTYLSLSHNYLSNSIPAQFYSKAWDEFDLSFNRFGGAIAKSIAMPLTNTSALYLQVNRLSGDVPISLVDTQVINVLTGNLFACGLSDKQLLPHNDPAYHAYQCGSDYVDYALVMWLIILVALVLAIVVFLLLKRKAVVRCFDFIQKSRMVYKDSSMTTIELKVNNIIEHGKTLQTFQYQLLWIMLYLLLIMTPVYIALSLSYGMQEHQYAWILSLSFLSGVTPALISMFLLLLLLVMVLSFYSLLSVKEWKRELQPPSEPEKQEEGMQPAKWTKAQVLNIAARTLFIISSCFVSVLVNLGFVLAINNTSLDTREIFAISLAVSVFKWIWALLLIDIFGLHWFATSNDNQTDRWIARILALASLFNNIIAPYIAEAFASPNCFYYVIHPAPAVTSQYPVIECTSQVQEVGEILELLLSCQKDITEATYNPPFQYSYQCSSSLLTSFALVFILRFVLTGIVLPCVKLSLKYLQEYGYKRSGQSSLLYRVLNPLIPIDLRPLTNLHKRSDVAVATNNPLLVGESTLAAGNSSESEEEGTQQSPQNETEDTFLPIMMRQQHKTRSVRLVSDFGVLMTFGVLFPPLALVIMFSMCCEMLIWQLCLARIVCIAREYTTRKALVDYVKATNEDLKGYSELFVSAAFPSVLILATLFWSYSLLEMIGDQVGAVKASWIIVVMSTAPGWCWLLYRLAAMWLKKCVVNNQTTEQDEEGTAESKDDVELVRQ